MSSNFLDYLGNTSFSGAIHLYWNSALLYLSELLSYVRNSQTQSLVQAVEKIPESITFDKFQWKLLKTFSALLLTNLILVVVIWKIYGKSICERFMKLSTLREIEELKASVSKLKLPKEHTPRI